MNKKLLIGAMAVVLVIGAGMVYVLLMKNREIEPAATMTTEKPAVEVSPPVDPPNSSKGSYVDYTEDSFASTTGTRLLFFHAPWCPQCRALDASIKTSEVPGGVTIFKVDYDSNQPLRAQYGVTLQTTVVKTDEKGNKISSYVAYDEPTFQSVKQALLP